MTDRNRMPARRGILAGMAGLPLLGWGAAAQEPLRRKADPPPSLRYGPARPFRHESLVEQAQALARGPYRPPVIRHSEQLARIGYDEHRQIAMRRDLAPRTAHSPVAVDLFHLANFFREPVSIHLVESGTARKILYASNVFEFGPASRFAAALPDDLGFAGFRLRNAATWKEWLSFLGASYFRSPGEEGEFGLSARGLAVDTAMPAGEEFPRFSAFWLEPLQGREDRLLIHALLEGPRVVGAYRIAARHGRGTITDVEATLFLRGDVGRLGIAPLTSMYWYGAVAMPFAFSCHVRCSPSSSEFEAALAGRVGQGLHPAMIAIAAAVEHDVLDAGLDGALGHQLADLHGCVLVAAALDPGLEILVETRSRGQRHALGIVDDLDVDVGR
jgi:glucans biosynthesis protein